MLKLILNTILLLINNINIVEAASKKKDKKKPTIKFSGKSSLTVEKGKSIKIPKTTAKDNVDGNVTKKLKVTVKKGKTSYSAIAKKIKANKSVKFTKTGKYTITYAVTDKAGNKATKKRYVTVEEPVTTNDTSSTTEATTEKVTTEKVTTETPTTEKTTEATTTETPTESVTVTPTDYSKYDIKEVTVNDHTYKTTRDTSFFDVIFDKVKSKQSQAYDENINITVENDYLEFDLDPTDKEYYNDSSILLELLGNIKATDSLGNDITDNIVIYDYTLSETENMDCVFRIYVEDSKGNANAKSIFVFYISSLKSDHSEQDLILKTEPFIRAYFRTNDVSSEN